MEPGNHASLRKAKSRWRQHPWKGSQRQRENTTHVCGFHFCGQGKSGSPARGLHHPLRWQGECGHSDSSARACSCNACHRLGGKEIRGREERMETSEQPATMTASFKIALPSPLAVAPQTPYSCLKCYRWVSVKGDRCQPCSPTAPDKRSSHHAASSPSYWPRQMHIQSPQLIPP